MRVLKLVIVALALFAVAAPPASALPFGARYNGGLFTVELVGSNVGLTRFTVDYTANLTNFTGFSGGQDYLYGVGFMPTPADIATGSVEGPGDWFYFNNELSAGGCRAGNDSFACASTWNGTMFVNRAQPTDGGDIFVWTFVLNYAAPVYNFSLDGISIKAAFSEDSTGATQRGLMSLTTAQVPEPTSMLLLGTGLLGAALLLSRRRR